ncbi:putative Methyltransferase type 11 [groundwater metagenome]|uniref:Putative Methyltransferase type 11 n=1 Tax=groundwater metagenome TaxID=717931 RepID=A0A098E6G6_9ZZZZ
MDALKIDSNEWKNLENVLEGMIPGYDNINSRMTFGRDKKWRKILINESSNKDIAVEIGSGPGTLAMMLKSKKIFCVDPSDKMHKIAGERIKQAKIPSEKFEFITAPAESIPINNDVADFVCCAFAFRDFYDKKKALTEIYRILKNNGKFMILDIAKHNNIYGTLIYDYIKHIAPIITGSDAPKMLAKTYNAFGTPEYYADIIKENGFKNIKIRFLNLRTIFILSAEKI